MSAGRPADHLPPHITQLTWFGERPDARFTTIERAPSGGNHWPLIDVFKLALDGSSRLERPTFFTTFRGYKADRSVISDDGRFILFDLGKSGTEAGQGFGIFLCDFTQAKRPQP